MHRIHRNIWIKRGYFLGSLLLPILILSIVYAKQGIYWGSETTLLASDAFPQLSNFYAHYHDVLRGKESFFYSWGGALGGNFWALSAYYLNSVFSFIVVFFSKSAIPDAIYMITLVKFGAIGGSFYLYAQGNFKVKRWMSLGISLCYALMSYSVAYSPINMWLDGLFYLPLIIWGINRLLANKSPWLLYLSYVGLFLSNYYIGFMIGVFSVFYVGIQLWLKASYRSSFWLYIRTAFLAGGTAMVVILPAVVDLRTNGESLSPINQWVTPDVGSMDLIMKQLIGSYDTAKFGSAPFLFVGLLPLLLALFFFISPKRTLREKGSYGALGILLLVSVYVYPLNLFWHGFHFPNMLLFRFSFLFSFLVCLLALYSLEQWDKTDFSSFCMLGLSVMVVVIATFVLKNPKRYDYVTGTNLIWTLAFLLFYISSFYSFQSNYQWVKRLLPFVLLGGICLEMGINTTDMIAGVSKDWNYPKRSSYSEYYTDIETLVGKAMKKMTKTGSFQRILNQDPISLNESFNFGYSGLTQFSSIRNREALTYLNKMGYRSDGTNLSIEGMNNTLIMDSFIGLGYILGKQKPLSFGYEKEGTSGEYQLYRNRYALPLGIQTDKGIYTAENVATQTDLWQYLSGSDQDYVQVTRLENERLTNGIHTDKGQTVTYSQKQPGTPVQVTWDVSVPAHTQGYIQLYTVNNVMMNEVKATVDVQGQQRTYDMKKLGDYYAIGSYDIATTVSVSITFTGSSAVQFPMPKVLLLNTDRFSSSAEAIQAKGVDLQVNKNTVTGTLNWKEPGVLLTTIAYDRGWRATIDGKRTPIQAFEGGLISFDVPKGSHSIALIYYPSGIGVGLVISLVSMVVFIGEQMVKKKKRRTSDDEQAEIRE